MRVTLVLVSALMAIAAMSDEANAQTGQGRGRQCRPGMTWQMCYERCLQLSGTARTDMMHCSQRCTKRGCQ
jgi:hypothetical protein